MVRNYLKIVIFIFLFHSVKSQIYNDLSNLEEIIHLEDQLISHLAQYINIEKRKINTLKNYVNIYQDEYKIASKNIQKYVENPVNAFLLIKHLTSDLELVENLMTNEASEDFMEIINDIQNSKKFPSENDLNEAATNLIRLQDIYKLNTSTIVNGEINRIQYGTKLTAADCFELGRQSHKNNDIYHAEMWMKEAEIQLKDDNFGPIHKFQILEYLSYIMYRKGNLLQALQLTNQILELHPTHWSAQENKWFYEKEMERIFGDSRIECFRNNTFRNHCPYNGWMKNDFIENLKTISSENNFLNSVNGSFEQLCRNENVLPVEEKSKLKCRYVRNNSFLLIAPLKVEELHLNPDLILFHNVMSDDEIEILKKLGESQLHLRQSPYFKIDEEQNSPLQIAKSGYIDTDDQNFLQSITKRMVDMTGLNLKNSELLYMVNYGIGGYYNPHVDFSNYSSYEEFSDLEMGNPVATILFYLSDVVEGGLTVFPFMKTVVKPSRGSALFWYNLYPNGKGDDRTIHGSCPVLIGTKLVLNKWIHEYW